MGFVADIIRKQAADDGDRPALTFEGTTRSFKDMDERSNRAAQALIAEGLKPGDRVAFLERNCPECYDMLFGCAKANLVHTPINWRLGPKEISMPIQDSGARILVCSPEFLPHIEAVRPEMPQLKKIVLLGEHPDYQNFNEWLGQQPAVDPQVPQSPDDVVTILYTSGTTGRPKGAMLTDSNLACTTGLTGPFWGFTRDSVNLLVLPLFHIGGSGWGLVGWVAGCHAIMLKAPDPAAILSAIATHKVTNTFLVPVLIQMVLDHPDGEKTDFTSLRKMIYGAAPISQGVLKRAMERFGCDFVGCLGLTESTNGFTYLAPDQHDPNGPKSYLLDSVGVPFPWAEVRIADIESGEELAPRQTGEVWLKSPGVMKGYWNLPEETAKTITADGWLKTGDAGYVDEEGNIYLVDRMKDLIISGGENIYPAEIENVLNDHPAISMVSAIGVPHEKWGETIKAVVILMPGASATAEEIIEFARKRIAHYKCPTSVDFVESMPLNATGKVLRRQLREPYWKGQK